MTWAESFHCGLPWFALGVSVAGLLYSSNRKVK